MSQENVEVVRKPLRVMRTDVTRARRGGGEPDERPLKHERPDRYGAPSAATEPSARCPLALHPNRGSAKERTGDGPARRPETGSASPLLGCYPDAVASNGRTCF